MLCDCCEKEMTAPEVISCDLVPVRMKDGTFRNPLTFQTEDKYVERCHDCRVLIGGFHHPGCDEEVCPKCGKFLNGCGCMSL